MTLAEEEAAVINASARSEVVAQQQAAVNEARAAVASIDAQIADRSIVAPFTGEIINVDIFPGETANTEPVITLLANTDFELTARIPEIDVTKVQPDQAAVVVFDAQPDTALAGNVTYISPLATEIDGVAYFESKITLAEAPTWLRSGLNADVDILVEEWVDTLRVPKRFIATEDDRHYVYLTEGEAVAKTEITVSFFGNDGYAAISGLTEGDIVTAPPSQ